MLHRAEGPSIGKRLYLIQNGEVTENMELEENLGECDLSESLWFLVTKGRKNAEVKPMDFVKEGYSKYGIGR